MDEETNENACNSKNDTSESPPETTSPAGTKSRKSKGGWFIIIAAVFFIAAIFLTHREDSIHWYDNLQTAENIARKQNKPLMITFHKQGAEHVTLMKRTTYNNAKIIDFVDRNFVPVLVHFEDNPELFRKYRITLYPTQLIKMPDSSNYSTIVGHHYPTVFMKRLKRALKEIHVEPR